jgi:hypothetical protein
MKNSILTLTQSHVNDNTEHISGNVAAYLINEAYEDNNYFFWYLSDKEIEEIDGHPELWSIKWEEVVNFLQDNFNYEIDK